MADEEGGKRGLLSRAADRAKAEVQHRRERPAASTGGVPAPEDVIGVSLTPEQRSQLTASGELYEYTVTAVRETLIGDKIDTGRLQGTLSQYAAQGWRLKSVTSASVAGRVGPGGVGGLVLVFERRIRA